MGREWLLIASAGLLAVGAWLLLRGEQAAADQADQASGESGAGLGDVADVLGDTITNIGGTVQQAGAAIVDTLTMGFSLSRMKTVTPADVVHPNVRAMLAVIRRGEGTAGPDGFRTLFGGGLFSSYATHPNQRITRKLGGRSITSTAAGAFQFLYGTWGETARIMGLADFSPANQERGAVGRIAARGALDDLKAGRFEVAVAKIATEWASLPGSPYGQPVITMAAARGVYAASGGTITTNTAST